MRAPSSVVLVVAAVVIALVPLSEARGGDVVASAERIEVAVTVDDLTRPPFDAPFESPDIVIDRMVASFARHHLPPVTGFLNGRTVVRHPEDRAALVRWLLADNRLGNHTYSHADLARVGARGFIADTDRNEDVLRRLAGPPIGDRDWRVFRYPFLQEGATVAAREAVRRHLFARGYRIAEVTVDFEDWQWFPAYARCVAQRSTFGVDRLRTLYREAAREELLAADALGRKLFGRRVRQILLLHAGAFTSDMLDDLLEEYEGLGVRFIPLDEALRDSAYHLDPRVARSWGSPFLYQLELAMHWRIPDEPWTPQDEVDALCR